MIRKEVDDTFNAIPLWFQNKNVYSTWFRVPLVPCDLQNTLHVAVSVAIATHGSNVWHFSFDFVGSLLNYTTTTYKHSHNFIPLEVRTKLHRQRILPTHKHYSQYCSVQSKWAKNANDISYLASFNSIKPVLKTTSTRSYAMFTHTILPIKTFLFLTLVEHLTNVTNIIFYKLS